jgi:hypothetical protein
MSSETSTEPQVRLKPDTTYESTLAPRRGSPDSRPHASAAFEPWQLFTLAGLIGATIAVFMSRGQSPAAVILLSLIVFAAAAVGIAALRMVLPLVQKGSAVEGPQVLGGRTRAALEREKTLALRTIKELEFDRAMGKVSEKDFTEMSGRLRSRAVRLMRQLDAGAGYRDEIEREIVKRIGAVPPPPSPHGSCPSCGTVNDADARFCKQCGRAVEAGS